MEEQRVCLKPNPEKPRKHWAAINLGDAESTT
jgi:hypothetical protein